MDILLSIQGNIDYRAIGRHSISKRYLDLYVARRIDYRLRYKIRVEVLASVNKATRRQ